VKYKKLIWAGHVVKVEQTNCTRRVWGETN